jgi:hypothetical protein
MLKGTTNLCSCLSPAQFPSSIAYQFLLEGESMHFVLQSTADDYAFTNLALVHLDGSGPIGKKRTARRYTWRDHMVYGVRLVTAGLVDQDFEILFGLRSKFSSEEFKIDVKKAELSQGIWLYKALITICEAQLQGERESEIGNRVLAAYTPGTYSAAVPIGGDPVTTFRSIREDLIRLSVCDYKWAFERYIRFEQSC